MRAQRRREETTSNFLGRVAMLLSPALSQLMLANPAQSRASRLLATLPWSLARTHTDCPKVSLP